MSRTPKAGDTVYSVDGRMAMYVSPATGGGYIVQPLIEDGDGVTEPESYYADGVELWPSVYLAAPKLKLDGEIAAQHEKLRALRAEVSELERQKREAERGSAEVKERLAMHQALSVLDDLLSGKVTHYVIDASENRNGTWKVVAADEFFTLRTHYSVMALRLHAFISGKGQRVQWKFSPNAAEPVRDEREAFAFKSEAEARAKVVEMVTEKLAETARHASNAYWLRKQIEWAQAQGVEVPAEIADQSARLERAELEHARKKATEELTKAEAALAALATA